MTKLLVLPAFRVVSPEVGLTWAEEYRGIHANFAGYTHCPPILASETIDSENELT
jgi:hypothetical protein